MIFAKNFLILGTVDFRERSNVIFEIKARFGLRIILLQNYGS